MADIGFYGDGGGSDPYDIGALGGQVNYTDPQPRSNTQSDPYGTVAGFYQSLLGRAPESQDAAMGWWNGTGGNIDAIRSGIAGSPEAQAYASRNTAQPSAPAPQQAPATGFQRGGNLRDPGYASQFVSYFGTQPGVNPSVRTDPNYWIGKLTSGELGSDENYIIQKMMTPEGPPAGGGGNAARPAAAAAAPVNPGGYTDPSSLAYLQEITNRLNQLHQPQDTQIYDLLKSLATEQATKLQQAPYTPADDAALITQYRQPITQARDTAKQQAALDMSRRGIGPTSGVYQDRMKQIDQAYVGGVAQGANQMGVNAVSLKNSNALQALQILSGLNTTTNTMTDRTNALSDRALEVAKMFPDFDATRLDQLLRASGDNSGSSSALNSLIGLGNLNLNTLNTNNANDQANAAAWGKLIAHILEGL